MRKDNTGYHLHHLMIGGEGSLGVVTKVCLQLPPLSISRQICFLGTTSFVKVKEIMVKAKRELGEILSAIEMMDSVSLEPVFRSMNIKNSSPNPRGSPAREFPKLLSPESSTSTSISSTSPT